MMFFITATVAPVCIFFFIYLTVNTRNTYMHQEDICHVFGLGLVTIIYSTMATENIASDWPKGFH